MVTICLHMLVIDENKVIAWMQLFGYDATLFMQSESNKEGECPATPQHWAYGSHRMHEFLMTYFISDCTMSIRKQW